MTVNVTHIGSSEGVEVPENPVDENTYRLKQKTAKIILQLAPEWKQRNMIARSSELMETMLSGGTLTADQQVEFDEIKAAWERIKAIREASNLAEQNGTLPENFNP